MMPLPLSRIAQWTGGRLHGADTLVDGFDVVDFLQVLTERCVELVDTDAAGNGVVTDHRLYQLVRQKGDIVPRTITIHFLDPGVEAYAFTFG